MGMQKLIARKFCLIVCAALLSMKVFADATLQEVVTAIDGAKEGNKVEIGALSGVIVSSDDRTRGYLKSLYDTKVQADTELMLQKSPVEDLTANAVTQLNVAENFANNYKFDIELNLWERSMLGFSLPFYSNGTLHADSTVLRPIKDLSSVEAKDPTIVATTAEYMLYDNMLHFCSDKSINQKAIKDCKPRIEDGMTATQAAYAPYKLSTLLGMDGYAQDSNQAVMAQELIGTLVVGLPQEKIQQALRAGKSQEYIAKAIIKEAQYSTARYSLNAAYVQRIQPVTKADDGSITVQPSEMELITKFTQDSLSEQTISGIAQSSSEALLRSLYYQIAFNNSMQVKLYKQGERMEALMAVTFARQGAEVKEQNDKEAAVRSIISNPGFMK